MQIIKMTQLVPDSELHPLDLESFGPNQGKDIFFENPLDDDATDEEILAVFHETNAIKVLDHYAIEVVEAVPAYNGNYRPFRTLGDIRKVTANLPDSTELGLVWADGPPSDSDPGVAIHGISTTPTMPNLVMVHVGLVPDANFPESEDDGGEDTTYQDDMENWNPSDDVEDEEDAAVETTEPDLRPFTVIYATTVEAASAMEAALLTEQEIGSRDPARFRPHFYVQEGGDTVSDALDLYGGSQEIDLSATDAPPRLPEQN